MKRSVAMMACVLSGALMISAYSPVVFAETTEKTEASKTDEAKDESEKKEDTSKVEVLEDGTYSKTTFKIFSNSVLKFSL